MQGLCNLSRNLSSDYLVVKNFSISLGKSSFLVFASMFPFTVSVLFFFSTFRFLSCSSTYTHCFNIMYFI